MTVTSVRVITSPKKTFFQTRFFFCQRFNNLFILILCFGEFTGKHTEKWQFMKNGNLGESIMARLPDAKNEQSKVTTVLRAIGNSKRLRILRLLSHIYDHYPVMRPRQH